MRFFRSRRGLILIATLMVVALFLVRPGAQRLRTRIIRSISLAVGRPVDIATVSLRFLPQPGFDFENFVVYDDPQFSAEPILRAQEVSATLRGSSLFRGRLEVARLSLSEPSFNLVRNAEGRWNLEELLQRAAQTPVAPTGKSKSESRPGFPYIEADHARINVKIGAEKKPYALTEADLALWQDSENSWGMRLKAQPMRMDFNLSDTGLLRVDGTWQRAAALRDTPVRFTLRWDQAQLGQATKLLFGDDKGWRGTVAFDTTVSGTPTDLKVESQAEIEDFRRYDIMTPGELRLVANCNSRYSSLDRHFSQILCLTPVGTGTVRLTGSMAALRPLKDYDVKLVAHDLPMQAFSSLLRRVKKNIPEDLTAAGTLNAEFTATRSDGSRQGQLAGKGETHEFRLSSRSAGTDLALGRIPFALAPDADSAAKAKKSSGASGIVAPTEPHVEIGPFEVALGRPSPATVQGWVSRSGYNFAILGDAQLQRLAPVSRSMGIPVAPMAADGIAKVDLQVGGSWTGFSPALVTGKAQLHNVHAELRGMNAPLEIAAADLTLSAEKVEARDFTASLAGTTWKGSLSAPRGCNAANGCAVHFDLHADEIATDKLSELLNPHPRSRPWYRLLAPTPQPGPYFLAGLKGTGSITATRVVIHKVVSTHVSAAVSLDRSVLQLTNLSGEVFGGKHSGEWTADLSAKPPSYTGTGNFDHVSLGQLAEAMHDSWVKGTANGRYRAAASGFTAKELVSSATGTLQVDARDGALPHIVLAGNNGPLEIRRLTAKLVLRDGHFQIEDGKMDTPSGSYQLSGTASVERNLDVKLVRAGAHAFSVTGSLTGPRVTSIALPETRAALKP